MATNIATPVTAVSIETDVQRSRLSWGAVIAGALIALGVSMALNLLWVGIGAVSVDFTNANSPDPASFGIGAAITLVISTVVGLGIGGFIAGRFGTSFDQDDGFAYGLAVWAITFILGASVIGGIASSAGIGALRGFSAGAGAALVSETGSIANQAIRTDGAVLTDRMARVLAANPATATPEQASAEIALLVGQRLRAGSFRDGQRARLVSLVQTAGQVPPDEAERRVSAIEQTLAETERQARAAADATAGAVALAAFWSFAAMILGGIACVAGAYAGLRGGVPYLARRRLMAGN